MTDRTHPRHAGAPRCPACGRRGEKVGPDTWRCALGHFFDADPDEGGSHDDRDPSRRLERQEERAIARRDNAQRRGQARRGFRFGK